MRRCPACGQPMPKAKSVAPGFAKFKAGDRVRHLAGAVGTVAHVDGTTVVVEYDENGDTSIYDLGWFNAFPKGLVKVRNEKRA